MAGGIWKCKGKTCGKTEGWRGRATASTILIINSMKRRPVYVHHQCTYTYCTVMKSSYVYYIIYHNQIDIESISYYLYHLCQSIYINQFMLLQRCTKNCSVSLDFDLGPSTTCCLLWWLHVKNFHINIIKESMTISVTIITLILVTRL